jgi:hypothetical protein
MGRVGDLFEERIVKEVATELSSDASSIMSRASGRMEVICCFLFLGLNFAIGIVNGCELSDR